MPVAANLPELAAVQAGAAVLGAAEQVNAASLAAAFDVGAPGVTRAAVGLGERRIDTASAAAQLAKTAAIVARSTIHGVAFKVFRGLATPVAADVWRRAVHDIRERAHTAHPPRAGSWIVGILALGRAAQSLGVELLNTVLSWPAGVAAVRASLVGIWIGAIGVAFETVAAIKWICRVCGARSILARGARRARVSGAAAVGRVGLEIYTPRAVRRVMIPV